jgi:hypothetical protein
VKSVVRLTVTIGNASALDEEQSLPQQLADAFSDIDVYEFSPPPNVVLANALEWQAILSVTADVAGIAAFIWLVWDKARASSPRSEVKDIGARPSPLLLIQLNPGGRKFRQLVVRESEISKEEFIAAFAQAVAELQSELPLQDPLITHNPNWVKVKRHDAAS